jgi:hypothetical protein
MLNKHIAINCYLDSITQSNFPKEDYAEIGREAEAAIRQIFKLTGAWPAKGQLINLSYSTFKVQGCSFFFPNRLSRQRFALQVMFDLLFIPE